MERGDRIGSEAAGLEIPAESALPTGLQTTNTVEDDNGRLPESSEARLGMSEGNNVLHESKNEITRPREERREEGELVGGVPTASPETTHQTGEQKTSLVRKGRIGSNQEMRENEETEKDAALREALATIKKM